MNTQLKTSMVLIVDDNPLVLDLVARGMTPLCQVNTAADGADALLKVIDNPPDLIISDYKMQGLDGRQLYEKLRGRPQTRHIQFIFVDSRGEIEGRLRPRVDGVEHSVPAPIYHQGLVRYDNDILV